MAVYLYDNALLNKLKSWTNNTNLHIYGPDETTRLFEVIADQNNDSPLQLPILCLRRKGGYQVLNVNKKPTAFDGLTLSANLDKSTQLNQIPIYITYQLDIYTRYLKEADEYMRNLVFNIINYPNLAIEIPYNNINKIHNSHIIMSAEIEDNSDIPERLIPSQFSRLSLQIIVDDAFLWDVRTRDNYSIDVHVE